MSDGGMLPEMTTELRFNDLNIGQAPLIQVGRHLLIIDYIW